MFLIGENFKNLIFSKNYKLKSASHFQTEKPPFYFAGIKSVCFCMVFNRVMFLEPLDQRVMWTFATTWHKASILQQLTFQSSPLKSLHGSVGTKHCFSIFSEITAWINWNQTLQQWCLEGDIYKKSSFDVDQTIKYGCHRLTASRLTCLLYKKK